jgi:hypothetical protein
MCSVLWPTGPSSSPEASETRVLLLITQRSQVQILSPLHRRSTRSEAVSGEIRRPPLVVCEAGCKPNVCGRCADISVAASPAAQGRGRLRRLAKDGGRRRTPGIHPRGLARSGHVGAPSPTGKRLNRHRRLPIARGLPRGRLYRPRRASCCAAASCPRSRTWTRLGRGGCV